MAFKMKGSAFKLGNVATKSAMKLKVEEHHPELDALRKGAKGKDKKNTIQDYTKARRKIMSDHSHVTHHEDDGSGNLEDHLASYSDMSGKDYKKSSNVPESSEGNSAGNVLPMKSPLEQTSIVDKVKSAGKAFVAGLGAKSTGRHSNVISTVSRAYKKEKKKYRNKDRKEKMKK